mmetsp:Transcript_7944/g.25001  ORF Transcript_7944/g.25001 Transcript_7944/m.25001 type:complete len:221 (-) Transcript_7944:98-760(-)
MKLSSSLALFVTALPAVSAIAILPARKSEALPWVVAPSHLEGVPGDAGFDPLGLGRASPAALKYYREAEIKHGRIAMLAAIGWPASELWDSPLASDFGLPALLTPKGEAPSVLNGGLDRVSPAFWGAAIGVAVAFELYGLALRFRADEPLEPGDLQFDPAGFYPVERARKRRMDLAEIKHGRIAMLAVTGYAAQEYLLGTPITSHSAGFFEPLWTFWWGL